MRTPQKEIANHCLNRYIMGKIFDLMGMGQLDRQAFEQHLILRNRLSGPSLTDQCLGTAYAMDLEKDIRDN